MRRRSRPRRSPREQDRIFFGLSLGPLLLGRLGVLAFVLRSRMRVWWHVRNGSIKLATLDASRPDDSGSGELLHFKSFAEMAPCCCPPVADLPGLTSGVMKRILRHFTLEHPLEVEFADGVPSKLRWVNGYTGKPTHIDLSAA